MRRRSQDEGLRPMLLRVPSVDKYRRMTCLTHVHSGICPYGHRCVFLHDPRVASVHVGLRACPSSKTTPRDYSKDTFYWPDQRKEDVGAKLEPGTNLPACTQEYKIPDIFKSSTSSSHDQAIFSIWGSFIDVLQDVRHKSPTVDSQYCEYNHHVPRKPRLPVFVSLSQGQSFLSPEKLTAAEGGEEHKESASDEVEVDPFPSIPPLNARTRYFTKRGLPVPEEGAWTKSAHLRLSEAPSPQPLCGVVPGADSSFTFQPHWSGVIGPDWFSLDLGAAEESEQEDEECSALDDAEE